MKQRSQVLQHLQKQGERNLTRSQKTSIVSAEKYLSENKIEEIMNELLAQVIFQKPKDVKGFLIDQLQQQVKSKGEHYYFTKQDFESIFLNYDFFKESKVPFTMLVQALGLVGVDINAGQFLAKYPKYQAQKYIVKEQFIIILTEEYKERVKKFNKRGQDDYALQAIAADSFVNDILHYCDLELFKGGSREGYGCLSRILDYLLKNVELCVVEQFKRALLPDLNPQQMALALNGIALEMLDRGYFDQSEPFLQASLNEKLKLYGEKSIEVAKTYNNFGLLYRQKGQNDEAMKQYQKALSIFEEVAGKNNIATVEVLENVAILLGIQQKFKQAREQYDKILSLKKAHYGANDINTALTEENIAVMLMKLHEYDEALLKLNQVLATKKRIEGENSLTVAGTLHNISVALEGKNDKKQALKVSKNALEISKNNSLTSSFIRTVEDQVKKLEKNLGPQDLDKSIEM